MDYLTKIIKFKSRKDVELETKFTINNNNEWSGILIFANMTTVGIFNFNNNLAI